MNNHAKLKAIQRDEGKSRRDALTFKKKEVKDKAILENLFSFEPVIDAKTIHVYISFGSECSTGDIIRWLMKQGKKVVVPITDSKNKVLTLSLLEEFGPSFLAKNSFGISEPIKRTDLRPSDVDLAILPGMLFDRSGGRMGYGGGYYDRLIPQITASATDDKKKLIVALAYSEQIIKKVHTTEHDMSVDYIISELEIIKCTTRALLKR